MEKTEKKMISITLVMVMLLAMLMPSISSAATGEVVIKDSKLKAEIAEQADLNKDGMITQEEMKNVTAIGIPDGVTDLTGLEYAINLNSIVMQYNKTMPDLSVLKSNSGIMMLIEINNVPEGHLAKLDFIKTMKDTISDLSLSIENNTKESYIAIDCESLKEVKKLTGLSLRKGAYPSDMKSIYACSNLVGLDISVDTGIYTSELGFSIDLDGIENLQKLEYLNLCGANIYNFEKVGELKKLTNLFINYVNIDNNKLVSLANCKKLAELSIGHMNISDISFLKDNENIKSLRILSAPIKDLSVISTMKNLNELVIEDVEGITIKSLEEYKNKYEKTTENKNEPKETTNSAKTSTNSKIETKTETKKQAEKPTRIPQAGVNVVGNAISILVAVSAVILAMAFVKAKRK